MDTAYNVLLDDIDYTYDAFGRLINYYDIISDVDYEYNYEGLSTSKTVDGVTTQFVLDGGNVIAEIVGDNVTNYVRGLTGIIYRKTSDGTKTYYVTNSHGDVVKLVNSSGVVIKTYEYDEYGNVIDYYFEEDDDNPFRYCGEYYDNESGLIYLRARYYDPTIGRFISEDPIRDNLNWYVYCGNNPINFVDPSGLTIILTGTEEEKQKTLEQLQMLTNDELEIDAKDGKTVIIVSNGTMNTDKTLTLGTTMISDIINNENFITEINREYTKNSGCEYNNANSNGIVITMNDWCEEGGKWGYQVSDGNGGTMFEDHKNVSHIVLGHELIHATHYMNGTVPSLSRTVYHYTDNGLESDIRNNQNG